MLNIDNFYSEKYQRCIIATCPQRENSVSGTHGPAAMPCVLPSLPFSLPLSLPPVFPFAYPSETEEAIHLKASKCKIKK